MTKLQFNEGDCLLDNNGYRLEVKNGVWDWYNYADGRYEDCDNGERAILDALTEIVKPLRTHKIVDTVYREDGYWHKGDYAWHLCDSAFPMHRDLFASWGWPIPDHMKEDAS